ncbi:hypothetical protein PLESTB_000530700 [Pleodorina starrii]|uniref:Uncharacterized protein n=1 Tax=Pleodorina starrii TaxID=330485 RepID=A0A9W6F0D4_9CHLO|nr:hypothetical protein PLESTM_000394200 [Pleodorina starrii]GLC51702.1 hypothetical protein PLESTB_000530700 [Pleodorina starrii]GLC72468.1 hypothetical protein PLESTF_001250900 [Pleodorina starrii]
MNNNKLDEPALLAGCKGVFSKSSYITIGTEGKPEEYGKKIQARSAYGGKHLSTVPPKDGKTVDVYFEKKHNWISSGDPYLDRIRYKDVQSEKKRGFQTSDFSKRDEFTNTIRTEQWREQLKAEGTHAKKALDMFAEAAGMESTPISIRKAAEAETVGFRGPFPQMGLLLLRIRAGAGRCDRPVLFRRSAQLSSGALGPRRTNRVGARMGSRKKIPQRRRRRR